MIELRPATELDGTALAALFTAAYEGYFVPFAIDRRAFAHMVDAFDLDLARSLVAVDDGTPIGLANLGLRGDRAWLGGIGVVPARRRAGVGELLTRGLLDGARDAGARELVLEVLVENAPALALYEKLGFARTRELEILSLPAGGEGGAAEDAPVEAALALIAARREGPETWQRESGTVGNLARRDPPPQAIVSGDAAAVYRADQGRVGLLQAAGGENGLGQLIAALRAKGPVSAANYPAGGAVAEAMRLAGAGVVLRQYELAVGL